MRAVTLCLLAGCAVARAADVAVLVADAAGHPLEGAVAWLAPTAGDVPPPPTARAVIDQRNKRFVPLVSVIQTGTQVDFPNSDNIRHSVYSFSAAKPFTLKLYAGRPAAPLTFDKPGVVLLGCNIHDTMVSWVAVVDSAWFGRSDAAGRVTLRDVPQGPYQLHVWHPGQQRELPPRSLAVAQAIDTQRVVLEATDIATVLKAAGTHPQHGGGS